jgi:carbamoyltransferase
VRFCLEHAGAAPEDVDFVAFYDKPFVKFERLLETYLAFAPRGYRSFAMALPLWIREKLLQKDLLASRLRRLGFPRDVDRRLLFAEHHQSHAASAFFPSPFSEAVVLTLDGVGEWATTAVSIGHGARLDPVREIHFPHSLGLLYSAFTYYTGFKVNSGEYKVMGLAPYGTPRFAALILEHLVDVKADGSFRLNQDYFDYCTGLRMTNARFDRLFGRPPRGADEPLEPFHMDVAASVQAVTDEIVLRLTRSLAAEFGVENLCLAGGVALNCVANGKVLRDGRFKRIWIQPAAGDAGGAVGAALAAYHLHLGRPRDVPGAPDGMSGSYLGPEFAPADIEARLTAAGARFAVAADDCAMLQTAVDALVSGQAVGWFQGRMEFGPRALGARSILGDPRSASMQ